MEKVQHLIDTLEEKGIVVKRWTKGEMDRLYVCDVEAAYSKIIGLKYTTYNSGRVMSATLNGEHISNAQASRLLARTDSKVYIDLNAEKVYYKGVYDVPELREEIQKIVEEEIKIEKAKNPRELIKDYLNEITDNKYEREADLCARCINPHDPLAADLERAKMWDRVDFDPAKYVNEYLDRKPSFTGYARLSRFFDHVDHKHWYRVRAMFDEVIKTDSDAGSVLLMKEDGSSVSISNGYGDGTTRIGVAEYGDETFDGNMMEDTGVSLTGTWYIMKYDCEHEFSEEMVAAKISGRFGVFNYEGIVAFVLYE